VGSPLSRLPGEARKGEVGGRADSSLGPSRFGMNAERPPGGSPVRAVTRFVCRWLLPAGTSASEPSVRRAAPSTGAGLVEVLISPILSLAFPDFCVSCGRPLESLHEHHACDACWRALRPLGPALCGCGYPLAGTQVVCASCATRPLSCGRGRSAFAYEGSLRHVIHAFKYGGRRSLARHLVRRSIPHWPPLSGVGLVPVPSHRRTLWKRGFNPADELACEMARQMGGRHHRLLRKIRRTPPQMTLTARERGTNLRGAFALRRGVGGFVRDAHLVLVDDICTTGATLRECAAVLLDAGASRVDFVTVARTL